MIQPPFAGYPAQVFATCYQALTWLNGLLANGAAQANSVANPAAVVFQLLRGGSQAIDAWQTATGLAIEVINLNAVEALPITLDPTTTAYFDARIAAISLAAEQIAALPPVPNPFTIIAQLQNGNGASLASGYLEWCMSFAGETPPTGFTAATLPAYANAAAQAWLNVANAIMVTQGSSPTSAYDTAARQYRCAATIAAMISQLQSGPFMAVPGAEIFFGQVTAAQLILIGGSSLPTRDPQNPLQLWNNDGFVCISEPGSATSAGGFTNNGGFLCLASPLGYPTSPSGLLGGAVWDNGTFVSVVAGGVSSPLSLMWNNVVALPTILLDASAISTTPSSLQAQQALTIRYVLDKTADSLALFLYSLGTSIGSQPITAVLSNNDTLLDLAARETGNFENWVQIAQINNLLPPFPGPTNQAIALSGRQLYMPGSNVAVGASGTPPSYPNDAMGTDYYFGPINGPQPAWNGDIPLIRGLLNFAQALGRRLQTPLGTLTYHTNYGSRIPAEVGNVQGANEAARLAAFGANALKADKRTARVLKATATVQPGFLSTFNGVVLPVGPGAVPISLGQPTGVIIPAQGP